MKELTSDEKKYETVLKGLILQALYTLMEKDVRIQCRAKDKGLVEQAKDEAQKEFKEAAGWDIKIDIDDSLPEERYVDGAVSSCLCASILTSEVFSAGGVALSGYGNRIKVDNTLDERLRLLEEQVRHIEAMVRCARLDILILSTCRCCQSFARRYSARTVRCGDGELFVSSASS